MRPPPAIALLEQVKSLPAARPLLECVGAGPPVHLVGGAVRDLLLGGAPADLDLVIEGDPGELLAALGGEARVHDRFGTATVVLDGFTYDLARSRRETYSRPGSLPDVAPAELREDLRRRDFTVNSAAIALNGVRPGELVSAPAALGDLGRRQLRVLHDRSFTDDPTRLLRLARYAGRLGFAVERHTGALAQAAIDRHALSTVSGSRIGHELRLLARETDPVAALGALRELGLEAEIEPGFGLRDPGLAAAALDLLRQDGRRDRLALALALDGVPVSRRVELLDRLAFEAADREAILATVARSGALAAALGRAGSPSQIAAAVDDAPLELVALAGALGPDQAARDWLGALRHVELEIGGDDLLAAGVAQGPAIGQGLRAALAAKLDGRASGREQELAEALRAAR